MQIKTILAIVGLLCGLATWAQPQDEIKSVSIDGKVVKIMITPEGDTLLLADLNGVSVTSSRQFDTYIEQRHYAKMKYNALKVYPYAVEAIRLFNEIENATEDMRNRKRKRYVKDLHREVKQKFEDPLKHLTRTQGYILVKMIERELNTPCYEVIKDLKGSFTASYWSQFSKVYGYNLKEGYDPNKDPILEAILSDLDLSYSKN